MEINWTSQPIEIDVVKAKLLERIALAEKYLEMYRKVDTILNAYNGRMISKRLITMFNEKYPEITVYLGNHKLSGYILYLWGNGLSQNNRVVLSLRTMEDSPNRLDYLKTTNNNGDWITTQENYLNKLKTFYRYFDLSTYVNTYNKLVQDFKEFTRIIEENNITFLFN